MGKYGNNNIHINNKTIIRKVFAANAALILLKNRT